MNVKIDTKEKFTVITPLEAEISANMSVELLNLIQSYRKKEVPHIIVNLENVKEMDDESRKKLSFIQHEFYENNCSFVICEMHKSLEGQFNDDEESELMNVTPTESEAWDIVQMEEIERELLSDFDHKDDNA